MKKSIYIDIIVNFLLLSIIMVFFLSLALFFDGENVGVSGFSVPDGVSLWRTAIRDQSSDGFEIWDQSQSAWLFLLLNARLIGFHNIFILSFNIFLLNFIFSSKLGNEKWPSALVIILVPYVVISALLPSKDIIVSALFLLTAKLFVGNKLPGLLLSILLCILIFTIRDGFGILLLITLVGTFFIESIGLKYSRALLAIGLISSCAMMLLVDIFGDLFVFARAISVANDGNTLDSSYTFLPFGYFLRLFGNVTNLAFRPIFFDILGNLHLLSVSFWISGLTLLYSIFCCLVALNIGSARDARLGMIGLSLVLLISITPYVQPRYLLPICFLLPMFSFVSSRHFFNSIKIILPISVAFSIVYRLSDNYPPPAEISDISVSDIFSR